MSTDLEKRVAETLAVHMPGGDAEWCANETCFYEFGAEGFHADMGFEEAFARHQAEMLTDALAPVIAEREAAAYRAGFDSAHDQHTEHRDRRNLPHPPIAYTNPYRSNDE